MKHNMDPYPAETQVELVKNVRFTQVKSLIEVTTIKKKHFEQLEIEKNIFKTFKEPVKIIGKCGHFLVCHTRTRVFRIQHIDFISYMGSEAMDQAQVNNEDRKHAYQKGIDEANDIIEKVNQLFKD